MIGRYHRVKLVSWRIVRRDDYDPGQCDFYITIEKQYTVRDRRTGLRKTHAKREHYIIWYCGRGHTYADEVRDGRFYECKHFTYTVLAAITRQRVREVHRGLPTSGVTRVAWQWYRWQTIFWRENRRLEKAGMKPALT